MNAAIDSAIREVTGVSVGWQHDTPTVWVYGEVRWMHDGRFEFEAECPRHVVRLASTKRVEIVTSLVKRYRDGESNMFLVELPEGMAEVLKLGAFVLDEDELERKRQRIDTSRAW